MNLKNVLIVLSSIAAVLGLLAFYIVFYANTGTYVIDSDASSNTVFSTSSITLASSTPSSTLSLASSSADSSSSIASAPFPLAGEFASNYATPPITWTEGAETMAVSNATLSGSQLTLQLQITMGVVAGCVPLNLRLITDENGDTAPPATPQFTFPDTGTCAGTPGETYSDQEVVFSVNPTALPLILTTGGNSNTFFEINTTSTNGLTIQLPPTAG